MDRPLFDYTVSASERELMDRPYVQMLEHVLYFSLAAGVLLASLVAYLAPNENLLKTIGSMVVVSAGVIVPVWWMYRKAKHNSVRPLRIRGDAVSIHLGMDEFSYLSVTQNQLVENQGRQTLRMRTLRRTYYIHLPEGAEGQRVLEEIQHRLPRHRFYPRPA